MTFLITAVCKCEGEYYFRYVAGSISHPNKAKDYEYISALELLNADWFKHIKDGENSSDEDAVEEAIRKKKERSAVILLFFEFSIIYDNICIIIML